MIIFPQALLALEDESDRSFMEDLFIQYHRVMYWTAYRTLGNRETAEDVVETACEKMVCKISVIRAVSRDKRRAYIVSMVRNAAIDWVRNEKRDRFVEDGESALEYSTGSKADPWECFLARERLENYARCIRTLSDADREILRLRFVLQLSEKEIAERLGIKLATAHSRVARAKHRAREKWEEMSDDE